MEINRIFSTQYIVLIFVYVTLKEIFHYLRNLKRIIPPQFHHLC